MGEPREVELKLELEPADLRRLERHAVFRGAGDPMHLRSVYFDTPEHDLAKAGLTLRVRQVGGRHVQTIKSGEGHGVGLFDRGEWETEVDGPEPDLNAARDTPLGDLPNWRGLRRSLAPVFETQIDRTTSRVTRDGASVDATLDRGDIRAGDVGIPVCTLELELKDGSSDALFGLARALDRTAPLRLEAASKAERGYRLLAPPRSRVAKAEAIDLDRSMTVADGFRAIAVSCLRHFRRNEPLLLAERDAEALHQVRVAIRRLRSALSLFGEVVADDVEARLKARLQRVSREFGDTRNLDVFLDLVRERAEEPEAAPGSEGLIARAGERREAAYDRVAATLRSRRFRLLMLDFAAWLDHGPWLSAGDPDGEAPRDRKLLDFAADVLDERRRKVRRKGRHLDRLSTAERHRVRIATKKLRYASEFFAALYPDKKSRKRHEAFVDALQTLQERLGKLNDIAAGHGLAEDLARETSSEDPGSTPEPAVFAAGVVTGERDAQVEGLIAAAVKAQAGFAKADPFW